MTVIVPPELVLRGVCAFRRCDRELLLGHYRANGIQWPRHELFYLLRQMTALSWARIGNMVGGRDHTSAVNSVNRVADRCAADADYADEIDQMRLAIFDLLKAEQVRPREPAIMIARRLRAAMLPSPDDIEQLTLSVLMAASVLASPDLTASEARHAALNLIGTANET